MARQVLVQSLDITKDDDGLPVVTFVMASGETYVVRYDPKPTRKAKRNG